MGGAQVVPAAVTKRDGIGDGTPGTVRVARTHSTHPPMNRAGAVLDPQFARAGPRARDPPHRGASLARNAHAPPRTSRACSARSAVSCGRRPGEHDHSGYYSAPGVRHQVSRPCAAPPCSHSREGAAGASDTGSDVPILVWNERSRLRSQGSIALPALASADLLPMRFYQFGHARELKVVTRRFAGVHSGAEARLLLAPENPT